MSPTSTQEILPDCCGWEYLRKNFSQPLRNSNHTEPSHISMHTIGTPIM